MQFEKEVKQMELQEEYSGETGGRGGDRGTRTRL